MLARKAVLLVGVLALLAGCEERAWMDEGDRVTRLAASAMLGENLIHVQGLDDGGHAHAFAGTLTVDARLAPPSGNASAGNWSVAVQPPDFVGDVEPSFPLQLDPPLAVNEFYDVALNASMGRTGAVFGTSVSVFLRAG